MGHSKKKFSTAVPTLIDSLYVGVSEAAQRCNPAVTEAQRLSACDVRQSLSSRHHTRGVAAYIVRV